MSLKIDVSDIVRDHCVTLVDGRTSRPSVIDWLLFFLLPLLIATLLVACGVFLDSTAVTVIITALAIFAGLLFNLLVLAHSLIRRSRESPTTSDGVERKLLQEIYANVSYSILVSLIALIALLLQVVVDSRVVTIAASALVYFLLGNFLLTLLMVLKRIHVMLGVEFGQH